MSEKKRSLGDVFEDIDGDLAFQSKVGPVKLTLGADPNLKPYQAAEKTMREVRERMAQVQRERLDYLAAKMPKARLDETQPTLSARLGHLKHGPGGSGLAGPCDADCRKCEVERVAQTVAPLNRPTPGPLDIEYDGVTLRVLVERDRFNRREYAQRDGEATPFAFTTAQRAAVSAHWSAELRAKVAAAKERDRNQVTMEHEE